MTSYLIKQFKLINSLGRSGISKELSQLPGAATFNTSTPRHMHCSSIRKVDVKTTLPYYDPVSRQTKWVEATVKDARGQKFTIEKNGFELIKQVTSLSTEDFHNDKDKIYSTYYQELAEDIKNHLGAGFVQVVMEPRIRTAGNKVGADIVKHDQGLFWIHANVIEPLIANQKKQFMMGRYMLFDVWKNISETPVAKNDLAVCDISSMTYPDDYTFAGVKSVEDSNRPIVPALRLLDHNKDKHKWFYFSGMKKDEILMLSQWDSENPENNKSCFHTAFHNPDAPQDAPARQSCDVRVWVFFPTKEPWKVVKHNVSEFRSTLTKENTNVHE